MMTPLSELLLREGAVVEDEDVGQRREDQDAEDGADDRAAAAGEQGAADDDRRDRVELPERPWVELPVVVRATSISAAMPQQTPTARRGRPCAA